MTAITQALPRPSAPPAYEDSPVSVCGALANRPVEEISSNELKNFPSDLLASEESRLKATVFKVLHATGWTLFMLGVIAVGMGELALPLAIVGGAVAILGMALIFSTIEPSDKYSITSILQKNPQERDAFFKLDKDGVSPAYHSLRSRLEKTTIFFKNGATVRAILQHCSDRKPHKFENNDTLRCSVPLRKDRETVIETLHLEQITPPRGQ